MTKLKQFRVSIAAADNIIKELRSTVVECDGRGMALILALESLKDSSEKVRLVEEIKK